jgi:flagellar protein FliO/FliZ
VLALVDPAVSIGPGTGGLVATGLMLLALGGAAWLLRRAAWIPGAARKPLKGLSVETAFSLGERRSLAVVSVEGRRLLLGLTPSNISLITELPRSEGAFHETLERHTRRGDQT